MKYLKLTGCAYVNDAVRAASDGVQRVENEVEADRLIELGLAQDVTSDFIPSAEAAASADAGSGEPQSLESPNIEE